MWNPGLTSFRICGPNVIYFTYRCNSIRYIDSATGETAGAAGADEMARYNRGDLQNGITAYEGEDQLKSLDDYRREHDWAGTITMTPGRGGGYIGVELAAYLLDEPIEDVRCLCEQGRFPGAYKTELFLPCDWIIPPDAFTAYRSSRRPGTRLPE